jgi:hypothetical protein
MQSACPWLFHELQEHCTGCTLPQTPIALLCTVTSNTGHFADLAPRCCAVTNAARPPVAIASAQVLDCLLNGHSSLASTCLLKVWHPGLASLHLCHGTCLPHLHRRVHCAPQWCPGGRRCRAALSAGNHCQLCWSCLAAGVGSQLWNAAVLCADSRTCAWLHHTLSCHNDLHGAFDASDAAMISTTLY